MGVQVWFDVSVWTRNVWLLRCIVSKLEASADCFESAVDKDEGKHENVTVSFYNK